MKIEVIENDELREFKLPDSWEDITSGNFTRISTIANREDLTETDRVILLISELSGIDYNTILKMDITHIEEFEKALSFLKDPMPEYKEEYIEVDNKKYYFKSDYTQLTFGEFISNEKISEGAKENIYKAFPKLLCVFLREKQDGVLEEFDGAFMKRETKFATIPIYKVIKVLMAFMNGEKEL